MIPVWLAHAWERLCRKSGCKKGSVTAIVVFLLSRLLHLKVSIIGHKYAEVLNQILQLLTTVQELTSPNTRTARIKRTPLSLIPSPHTALLSLLLLPLYFLYVWMHLKCERLLQQRGKRKRDQPAHVERHGCSLMWLQLGSPGPNEVLWSSATSSPIAYTPAAHILPRLHHSGSLRRCSQIPLGTPERKDLQKKKSALKIGTLEFG